MTDYYLTAFLSKIRGVRIVLNPWALYHLLIYRMIMRMESTLAWHIGVWVPLSWTLGALSMATLTLTLKGQLTSTRLSMGTPQVSHLLHIRWSFRSICCFIPFQGCIPLSMHQTHRVQVYTRVYGQIALIHFTPSSAGANRSCYPASRKTVS